MIIGQKRINVTYQTKIYDTLTYRFEEGETCMDIDMAEEWAEALLNGYEFVDVLSQIENILMANEKLKGRFYVIGSIKGYKEVEEW